MDAMFDILLRDQCSAAVRDVCRNSVLAATPSYHKSALKAIGFHGWESPKENNYSMTQEGYR